MTEEEFRRAMNNANRTNGICILMHGDREVIAVGLDSSRGVAILFKAGEVPLSELHAGFEQPSNKNWENL